MAKKGCGGQNDPGMGDSKGKSGKQQGKGKPKGTVVGGQNNPGSAGAGDSPRRRGSSNDPGSAPR